MCEHAVWVRDGGSSMGNRDVKPILAFEGASKGAWLQGYPP